MKRRQIFSIENCDPKGIEDTCHMFKEKLSNSSLWGDRGAGARENRGREGYGRRERKGREEGVLRERQAGEKCETLTFLIQRRVRVLSKTRTQNIFHLHLTSSQSLLRFLNKRANGNLRLG